MFLNRIATLFFLAISFTFFSQKKVVVKDTLQVNVLDEVIVTATRTYAKIKIISHYKENDASNPANGRYHTFNYVYNPNLGDNNLE